jgi:nucleoside-diphosphate-sugar epimerase
MRLFGLLPKEDFETLDSLTSELIQEIGDINFVIVGASGFLGRWISTYFTYMQQNKKFLGTVSFVLRDREKISEIQNIPVSPLRRIIQIDTLGEESFNHFNQERIVIIYAASSTSPTTLAGEETSREAIALAEKIISNLPDQHTTFVHLSSGGIYELGARILQGIPKNYELQNKSDNAYLNEKISIEKWSQEQTKSGRLISRNPRLFSFYGPGLQLDRHFAIGEFIKRARTGLPIQIRGNPRNIRSYLYPTDAVRQLLLQCKLSEPSYEQVGSAIPITILQVGQIIANSYGVPIEILKNHSLAIDNYVPLDVPREKEKNFDEGIKIWGRWLNNTTINHLFD